MEGLEYNPPSGFEIIKTRSNNLSFEFITVTPKDYAYRSSCWGCEQVIILFRIKRANNKLTQTSINFVTRLFRNFVCSLSKLCYIPSLVGFHAYVHASLRIRLVTHPVHATVVSFCQANWRCEPRHVLQRPRENNTCLHTAGSHSLTTRCHCPRGTSASPFLAFSPSRPLPLFYTSSFPPSSLLSFLSHFFLFFFLLVSLSTRPPFSSPPYFWTFSFFFPLFCRWYGEVACLHAPRATTTGLPMFREL